MYVPNGKQITSNWMVFYETEGDLVRRFVTTIYFHELQTVTKFWVALIEANAVFWNENRYLTNRCSYLLLIIIKIIFPRGRNDARPEVDTFL